MIEIKRATPNDAKILADLGQSTFIDAFAKDNTKEDLDLYVAANFSADKQLQEILDPKRIIEIAWIANQPVGFLHLFKSHPDPAVTGDRPIELLKLYVDSSQHGKGVGPALMDKCIQLARNETFQTIWLGVWEKNIKAQRFYKKYGFITVGTHIFRVGTDDQVDFVMARKI